jgi:hypothetical protein
MSERVFLALTAVVAFVAAPLAAQSTAQLEARVRRLEAKEQALKDSASLGEERLFQGQPRRYFAVAGITLGFPVEVASAAERSLREVEGDWRARYGSALGLLANDTLTFMIWPETDSTPFAKISWRFAGQRGETQVWATDVAHGRWFTWLPRQRLQVWETSLFGPPMREWLKAGAPSLDAWDGRFARRDLLFSPSGPARRCLAGSLGDCQRALALREGADPFTEWYDRADLVAMARDDRHRSDDAGLASCRATGELEACRKALGGSAGIIGPPTGTGVRGALYLFALAQGGPDALVRLHAAGERPPAEQLAVASGMPIDSLLAKWHAAVIVPLPDQGVGESIKLLAVAALWMVVLLALFAWRYRWHHV